MKIKLKGNKIMQPVGGLVGGVGATLIDQYLPIENSTAKTALIAVAGAGLSAFTKNEMLQGMGAGILGVVGANLYAGFAVSGLPSRNVMLGNASNWIGKHIISGSEMNPGNGLPAGNKSVY